MFMRVISKLYSCHFFGWFWHQGNAGLIKLIEEVSFFSLSWKRLWCYFFPKTLGRIERFLHVNFDPYLTPYTKPVWMMKTSLADEI